MSASHTVVCEFASRPGHTKDCHTNGTNCLPAWHAMHKGRSLTAQPNCPKGRVVCTTVYGDMHLKDLLGSIVRVGYLRIGILSSATWPSLPKKHYNGLNHSKPAYIGCVKDVLEAILCQWWLKSKSSQINL